MAESAALLVDEVLPEQPVRQWVLSFPYPLRFLFASQSAIMRGVLGIVYRAIASCLPVGAGGGLRKQFPCNLRGVSAQPEAGIVHHRRCEGEDPQRGRGLGHLAASAQALSDVNGVNGDRPLFSLEDVVCPFLFLAVENDQ
jgi:hypothetical protein